jgi:hypothetical protein
MFFRRKNPFPAGSNFSFARKSHSGWVKSPVARRDMPLILAQYASVSREVFREVALENLEWMWRSATYFILSCIKFIKITSGFSRKYLNKLKINPDFHTAGLLRLKNSDLGRGSRAFYRFLKMLKYKIRRSIY